MDYESVFESTTQKLDSDAWKSLLWMYTYTPCCCSQEYIRQMGACLLQMPSGTGSAAEPRLHQLTFEAIRLVGRRLRLNPSGHRALLSSNASCAHAPTHKLQPQHYTHLLVCLLPCALANASIFSCNGRNPALCFVAGCWLCADPS